jgi:hypothetical protein
MSNHQIKIEKGTEKEKEIKEYFESLRPLARVFSGYGVYELKVDPKAESFYFDHKNKEIVVSPKLIEQLNLEREEKKICFLA